MLLAMELLVEEEDVKLVVVDWLSVDDVEDDDEEDVSSELVNILATVLDDMTY
jgi:hypothetical protein